MDLDINKLVAELIKQFSAPVYDGLKRVGKESLDKIKVALDFCFAAYLERSYDRYSKTKTLLYREIPVKLKDFYVRTDLEVNFSRIVNEAKFLDEVEANQRVVISGTAGSGKSTFCRSIFLDLVEKPRGILPLFVELRHLNNIKDKGLVDFVVESMVAIEPSFTAKQLDYAFRLGKVMLILDGFDEINSEDRDRFEKEITQLAGKYQKILIIVSSRPDKRFSSWEEFFQYRVLPLDKDKALSLISKLDYDRQVKRSFIEALDKRLFETHTSFARNPLLLTMMLLTYEQIAEIPNKIHLFYEQAFLTLFNKHDSLKSLYKRKSFSGLPLDDFKKVLAAFCVLSYADKKYYFEEGRIDEYLSKAMTVCGLETRSQDFLNDLLDSVCIIQRDGLGFTFTHRSFQEYFTALFLVGMARKNKYDIFNKIAFVNDRDDVIPMIFDINSDLLEQEWIIPRLEGMISEFAILPSTNLGKIMAVSIMYEGLVVHMQEEEDEEEDEESSASRNPTIAYRLKHDNDDHAHFMMLLSRLYPGQRRLFFEKRTHRSESQQHAEQELIRIDLANIDCLSLADIDNLSRATKSRIVKSGCCEYVMTTLDFAKAMLTFLKKT
jgi:hypothetical protein